MSRFMEMRKIIQELSVQESKQLLMLIMHQIDLADGQAQNTDLYDHFKKMYDNLLTVKQQLSHWEPDANTTTVHIVFHQFSAGSLKWVIEKSGSAETDKIISFHRDHFAEGPLWEPA